MPVAYFRSFNKQVLAALAQYLHFIMGSELCFSRVTSPFVSTVL